MTVTEYKANRKLLMKKIYNACTRTNCSKKIQTNLNIFERIYLNGRSLRAWVATEALSFPPLFD